MPAIKVDRVRGLQLMLVLGASLVNIVGSDGEARNHVTVDSEQHAEIFFNQN